jgi:hypothetical protein
MPPKFTSGDRPGFDGSPARLGGGGWRRNHRRTKGQHGDRASQANGSWTGEDGIVQAASRERWGMRAPRTQQLHSSKSPGCQTGSRQGRNADRVRRKERPVESWRGARRLSSAGWRNCPWHPIRRAMPQRSQKRCLTIAPAGIRHTRSWRPGTGLAPTPDSRPSRTRRG